MTPAGHATAELAVSGSGRDARFAEVRRVIDDARQAGLVLLVAGNDLRYASTTHSASEHLRSRLHSFRNDVVAELSRPGFRTGDRSSLPVRLPQYWLGWWSELKVNLLLANITHVAWRLRGPRCADRFRHALAAVVARHSLLSANIADHEDFLQLEFGSECSLAHDSLSNDLPGRRRGIDGAQAAIAEIIWAAAGDGPVFRPFLVQISPDEAICGFVLHHLVADFFASQLVARELCRQLLTPSAVAADRARCLEYSEYVRAMTLWENGPAGHYRLAYWTAHLRDAPTVILPPTISAPVDRVSELRTVELAIDGELRTRLAQVADTCATTLAQVLLAAKFATLAAFLRQTDLLVIVLVSGRDDPALLTFVGNTADCLAVRLEVQQTRPFQSLLEQLRSIYTLACRYRVKWELVREALTGAHTGIVAPTFNFVSAGRVSAPGPNSRILSRGNVSLETMRVARPAEQGSSAWHTSHDMNLFDSGNRIDGHVKYLPARQSSATVEAFVHCFLTCLRRIAAQPASAISDLV